MPRAKKITNPAQDVLARFLQLPVDAQAALLDTMKTVVAAQQPAVVKRTAPKPVAAKMALPKVAKPAASPVPQTGPVTFAPENAVALRGPKRRTPTKTTTPITPVTIPADLGVETIGENDQD